jgi:hypothetical protein
MGWQIPGSDISLKTTAATFAFLLAAMAGAEAFGQAPPNAAPENTSAATPSGPEVSMPTGRTLLALGTVFSVVGITLTGVGAWSLATVHCWDCPTDGFGEPGGAGIALVVLGVLHLIPGLVMFVAGASRYDSYKKAMREQMALEEGGVLMIPSLAILPEGGAAGALTSCPCRSCPCPGSQGSRTWRS